VVRQQLTGLRFHISGFDFVNFGLTCTGWYVYDCGEMTDCVCLGTVPVHSQREKPFVVYIIQMTNEKVFT
jgi:hypothetical protein